MPGPDPTALRCSRGRDCGRPAGNYQRQSAQPGSAIRLEHAGMHAASRFPQSRSGQDAPCDVQPVNDGQRKALRTVDALRSLAGLHVQLRHRRAPPGARHGARVPKQAVVKGCVATPCWKRSRRSTRAARASNNFVASAWPLPASGSEKGRVCGVGARKQRGRLHRIEKIIRFLK